MGIGLSSGSSGKSEAPSPSAAQCSSSLIIHSFSGHHWSAGHRHSSEGWCEKAAARRAHRIMPALGDNWALEGLVTEETLEWYFLLVASHFIVFVLLDTTGMLIKFVFDLPPILVIWTVMEEFAVVFEAAKTNLLVVLTNVELVIPAHGDAGELGWGPSSPFWRKQCP